MRANEVPNSCGGLRESPDRILANPVGGGGEGRGSDGPLQSSFPEGLRSFLCKPQNSEANVLPEKNSCGDC